MAIVATWASALLFCFLSIRRWISVPLSAIALFAAMMASTERFLPRPELATFVGIAVFYWVLQGGRYRSWRGLAALGVVQILWTNSHGLFVIGPFMVACYWIPACSARLRGRDSDLPRLTASLGVVLLCSICTPYGLAAWRYSLLLLMEAGGQGHEVIQTALRGIL